MWHLSRLGWLGVCLVWGFRVSGVTVLLLVGCGGACAAVLGKVVAGQP
jgi:hypothetical protein